MFVRRSLEMSSFAGVIANLWHAHLARDLRAGRPCHFSTKPAPATFLACPPWSFQLKECLAMNPKENGSARDQRVLRLYEQLVEIEQRLIPTGLHVLGRASELDEKADLLRMVASFDRPEQGVRALPKLVAEALGIDSYDALLQETSASETRELIDSVVSDAVREFCRNGADAAVKWLDSTAGVNGEESLPVFLLLANIAEQL